MSLTTTNADRFRAETLRANENKKFSKKLLTKTKKAVRYVSRSEMSGKRKNRTSSSEKVERET